MRYFLVFLLLVIAPCCMLRAQEAAGFIRRGNQEFKEGKFYESELEYRKALELKGESPKAQFNLGGALYRQEKYDEAVQSYKQLVGREDVSEAVRAGAFYNLGNTFYQQKHYAESVQAYKEALRLNPGAKDVKYNLSAALRMLQQQQQEQQNKNQDQQQDNNQQQKQQGSGGKDDRQKRDNQEQSSNSDQQDQQTGDKNNNQDQQADNKGEHNKQDSQSGQSQQQKAQSQQQKGTAMSQEEAERLLKALENQEGALREKIQKEKAREVERKKRKKQKDW